MESAQRVQFLREYGAVRHAEGRGSDDPAYYLALPYRDLSGQNDQQWQIRGRSFRYLERVILPPLERRAERPLDILDLGAGNCWMSYRLALRKHRPVALDIFSDQRDGLGAVRHYPVPFQRSKHSSTNCHSARQRLIWPFLMPPCTTRQIFTGRYGNPWNVCGREAGSLSLIRLSTRVQNMGSA